MARLPKRRVKLGDPFEGKAQAKKTLDTMDEHKEQGIEKPYRNQITIQLEVRAADWKAFRKRIDASDEKLRVMYSDIKHEVKAQIAKQLDDHQFPIAISEVMVGLDPAGAQSRSYFLGVRVTFTILENRVAEAACRIRSEQIEKKLRKRFLRFCHEIGIDSKTVTSDCMTFDKAYEDVFLRSMEPGAESIERFGPIPEND